MYDVLSHTTSVLWLDLYPILLQIRILFAPIVELNQIEDNKAAMLQLKCQNIQGLLFMEYMLFPITYRKPIKDNIKKNSISSTVRRKL